MAKEDGKRLEILDLGYSEDKDTDGYCAADLRLCFCISKKASSLMMWLISSLPFSISIYVLYFLRNFLLIDIYLGITPVKNRQRFFKTLVAEFKKK